MKRKGFTFIEAVITLTILVILSTIAGPMYKDYIRQAKMAEGYALAAQIRDAHFKYYSEYGNFLDGNHCSAGGRLNYTTNEPILEVNAFGNKYFTCFQVNANGAWYSGFSFYVQGKGGTIKVVYSKNLSASMDFIG